MIESVLLFHDDGTCEVFHVRSAPPPIGWPTVDFDEDTVKVAVVKPKKKKRAKPRKRCQTCDKLVERDQFDAHVEGHAPQAKQAGPRSWEEIEAEAAEALDEPVQEEDV